MRTQFFRTLRKGLSILEYFISTHGARKGLADTALKTADAGYLTRRLVDVAQDVVINMEDCGTLRGLIATPLKKNDEIVEPLSDRIIGRSAVQAIYHPVTDEMIVDAGELITDIVAAGIDAAGIDEVEIRSVLTCEMRRGVCSKCYGRNLATQRPAVNGDAVGVIAAQSIGEPGTQLTLRTFHVGGTASNIADENDLKAKTAGQIDIDELRMIETKDKNGDKSNVVVGRSAELKITDSKGLVTMNAIIPYGAEMMIDNNTKLKKG